MYEHLRTTQKLDRFDFWRMLKAFLPRGPIWHIAQPNESDIKPNGIPSSEGWGRNIISSSGFIYIAPYGIIAEEQWGQITVEQLLRILPVGIQSHEDFGVPVLTHSLNVFVNGIISRERFGTPSLGDFFIIEDTFEDGLIDPYWADGYRFNWDIFYNNTINMYFTRRQVGNGVDRLTPDDTLYTGDFTFDCDIVLFPETQTFPQVYFTLHKENGTRWIDVGYDGTKLIFMLEQVEQASHPLVVPSVSNIPMRIQRVGDETYVYFNLGEGWVRHDAWENSGPILTEWSTPFYVQLQGADLNGVSVIGLTCEGTLR